jgi:hypothetical protein
MLARAADGKNMAGVLGLTCEGRRSTAGSSGWWRAEAVQGRVQVRPDLLQQLPDAGLAVFLLGISLRQATTAAAPGGPRQRKRVL